MSEPRVITTHETRPPSLDLDRLAEKVRTSEVVLWSLVVLPPLVGLAITLVLSLSVVASLVTVGFLLAVAYAGHRAMAMYLGTVLRLLIATRLTLIVGLAALLFCVSGQVWIGLISAIVLWLVADRLLGRRALYDLWKTVDRNS